MGHRWTAPTYSWLATRRAEAVLHRADPDGTARGEALLLDDGRIVPAEVVVFTTGVKPRVDVAVASGIETHHGVVADDRLATSAEDVYAIGECAEHRGSTFGLVAPCWEQAEVIADLLSGANADARYRGTPAYSRLKVAEVDVASLGVVHPGPDDEVIEVVERRRRVYRKLVVRHGHLLGAILVGDAAPAARLIRLLDRGEPLPPTRLDVFCSADAYRTDVTDSVLCTCKGVRGEAVATAIGAGCRTVEQIGQATRAGTGCGSCASEIRRLLERQPIAAA